MEEMRFIIEKYKEIRDEVGHSKQLQWTISSVIANMTLTLIIWIGVYEMKTNHELSKMYFLGTSDEFTTGNQLFDGMINGFGTIIVLGIVSFVMLGFALFDFRKIVKAWLGISCLLILFGISGATVYDFCLKFLDPNENAQFYTICAIVTTSSLIYGTFGVLAFFFNSSLWTHQFYVITNCSLIATFYLRVFPGNTAWFVLWSVVFWDIFAVLAPIGPLRKVQEKATDYSNNILRLLMFTANENRAIAGSDGATTNENNENPLVNGVKRLIEIYSRQEGIHNDLAEKIRQRRMAIQPVTDENEKSAPVFTDSSPIDPIPSASESSSSTESSTSSYSSTCSEFVNEKSLDDVSTCEEIVKKSSSEDDDEEDVNNSNFINNEESVASKYQTAADALNDGDCVRLGFGDFVFYSLMIGQSATSGSFLVTFGTGFGIILGLILTLTILSNSEHTTPALPMSVIIGTFMHFYFISLIWIHQKLTQPSIDSLNEF